MSTVSDGDTAGVAAGVGDGALEVVLPDGDGFFGIESVGVAGTGVIAPGVAGAAESVAPALSPVF